MIIKKFKKIDSTNELAKKLRPKPWTIILAEEQKKGYGQIGRSWYSPKGGLYFTLVLPKVKIDNLQFLTLLVAFSIAKVIKEKFGLEPFIKLPNDIYINQKKVAGILIENIMGKKLLFSIVGIGINTNIDSFPKELKNIATSFKIELGKKIKNEELLKEIIYEIKEQIKVINF